jgi:radical SAM superfamily enzyme
MRQAAIVSELPLTALKFHQLQLVKGTLMEKEYLESPGDYHFYSAEEYIDLVIDYTERLNPGIMIERFAGESTSDYNLTPGKWDMRYDRVLQRIAARMEERDTWQGKWYNSKERADNR